MTSIESKKKAKPNRIQRKRTKGWKMPENTVYVGRGTEWGNPFLVDGPSGYSRLGAILGFKAYSAWRISLYEDPFWLSPLKGKNLACFCSLDQQCHADVLLELANA